jgi:hypothetical protein
MKILWKDLTYILKIDIYCLAAAVIHYDCNQI